MKKKKERPVDVAPSDWKIKNGIWVPPSSADKEFKIAGFKPEKPGFTLIELMVVIAIMGILAAISIPKFCMLMDESKISAYYHKQIDAAPYKEKVLLEMKQEALDKYKRDCRIHPGSPNIENYTVNMDKSSRRERYEDPQTRTIPALGRFRLQDGSVVECRKIEMVYGMTSLMECLDGKNYFSQTNITQLE